MNDRLQQLALFVRTVETGASHEQLLNSAARNLPPRARRRRSKVDLDDTTSGDQRYHDPCPYRGPLVGLLLPHLLDVKGRGDG